MPEQTEYFDKFLAEKFQHIDESIKHIDQKVDEIVKDNKEFKDEIKADNKATRRWIFGTVVGTGITVLFGLAAILLTFIQIQNSWMQQVVSFVGKIIVK
jgi:uncharacterized membrane protein YcjF (UPF0283 family)